MILNKRESELSIDKTLLPPWAQIDRNLNGTLKSITLWDGSQVTIDELKKIIDSKSVLDNWAAQRLLDAIKWWWEFDLNTYIIPLDRKERIPTIPLDTKEYIPLFSWDKWFPQEIDLMRDKFPEYPFKAKDGSLHPDMAWVERANASDYDTRGFLKPEKYIDTGLIPYNTTKDYIIPIIHKKDLDIFPKNPK